MPVRVFILLLFLSVLYCPAMAQTIRGEVVDMENKQPLTDVSVENIYTGLDISSDSKGSFLIAAASGQLLEFKRQGYKTTRVRVPMGYVPPYFKIIMKSGITDLHNVDIAASNRYDYTEDSIRYHEIYKHELDFPKMSGIDMVASPFSAFSKKNRQVWNFQDESANFEKEKYVDKTFNPELVTRFTGLSGDSLRYFMRRYRPTYEQLKGMNDYAFYSFIKKSVTTFRNSGNRINAK
jgi:hypothetical protein